jgi:hypothetical protein
MGILYPGAGGPTRREARARFTVEDAEGAEEGRGKERGRNFLSLVSFFPSVFLCALRILCGESCPGLLRAC